MEIEASVRLEDSSFLFGERGQKVCGRHNYKRREDSVHQAGQSATPKKLEVLAHLTGVHIIRKLLLFH